MALTGIEILKLLPRIDCQKCGYPNCLAFAMKLHAKEESVELCQRITEPAKKLLQEKCIT